jgi:poly(A) polymerase
LHYNKTKEYAMTAADALAILSAHGYSVFLRGFSAIDSWLGRSAPAETRVLTNADIAGLARLFENLRYPGVDVADAALDCAEGSLYFHCESRQPSFKLLAFYQDLSQKKFRRFIDTCEVYPLLRVMRKYAAAQSRAVSSFEILRDTLNPHAEYYHALMDAALILAKYFPGSENTVDDCVNDIEKTAALFRGLSEGPAPGTEEQRLLLCGLLTAPNPATGLELLKCCGFIDEFWPELARLDDVDHSKEFHPEGNAWKHTLETFRYRKIGSSGSYDLRLSLGLLLHDAGKPIAEASGRRRFDGHAELGEAQARRFLERLGFEASFTADVGYLVKNHMLPAALPRLPLARTGEIMASPLFPTLMELYRCDESSSFKGLDRYYESSAAYQSFLRNRRNPYRSADGKKMKQGQMGR